MIKQIIVKQSKVDEIGYDLSVVVNGVCNHAGAELTKFEVLGFMPYFAYQCENRRCKEILQTLPDDPEEYEYAD